MRDRLPSICTALLYGLSVAQFAAAQQSPPTTPNTTGADNVDRGTLFCPRSILAEVREWQKHCRPQDEERAKALDGPIGKLETFFLENRWADRDQIANAHSFFEKEAKQFQDHPVQPPEGIVADICNYENFSRLYETMRDGSETGHHWTS